MKIEYINNDETLGIKYNFKLIEKEYNKLNIPSNVYHPNFKNFFKAPYHMLLSERSTGKTTNILLLGMTFNKLYKTEMVYIRQTKDMIAPSKSLTMFNTIIEYDDGKYIRETTNGEYNNIYYRWKQYYYCEVDETGKRVKTSEKPFMYAMSVDEAYNYKSAFNNPLADFIIFDEFIGKTYRVNEFVDYMDLQKTICRDRLSPIVFLLANTINVNSAYFKEFEISREVRKMKIGTYKYLKSSRGTSIYVEMSVNMNNKRIKKKVNEIFYAFKNPRMDSITGEGETWAFNSVPHILVYDGERNKYEKRVLQRNIYIKLLNELLQLEFKEIEGIGIVLEVHPATYTYDDSIILTEWTDINKDKREISRLAHGTRLYKNIMNMYKWNKIYFSDNETGELFYNYINNINSKY